MANPGAGGVLFRKQQRVYRHAVCRTKWERERERELKRRGCVENTSERVFGLMPPLCAFVVDLSATRDKNDNDELMQ